MRRLILFVHRAGQVDVGELVERELAVGLRRRGLAVGVHVGELLHALVARVALQVVAQRIQPTHEHLEAGARQGGPQPTVERLMEVAHAAQLGAGPRLVHPALVARQLRGREVIRDEALVDLFGRQHAALDREVDALQATTVQEARRVAGQQQAIGVQLGHRVPAALGDRLGPVAHRFAALEQRRDQRVRLQLLQVAVRVAGRVLRIETGDHADVPEGVGESVDESAAERVRWQREVHGVDDAALLSPAGRDLPQLLHAGGVVLRLLAVHESERLLELLADGAARAFAQDRDLGHAIGTGLVRGLTVAVLVDTLVAGANAQHLAALEQRRLRGRLGGDQDAALLGLRRQPLREFAERHDRIAVVVESRGRER